MLSFDAVFRPFESFFLQKFGTGEDAGVHFRFANTPQSLAESDFVGAGSSSPALAKEHFSILVDGLPTFHRDERRVSMGPRRISELYHDEILLPAVPARGLADADDFSQLKSEALHRWESTRLASLLNHGTDYLPSEAIPAEWWDAHRPEVWTHQTFAVKNSTAPTAPEARDAGGLFGFLRPRLYGTRGKPTQASVSEVEIDFDFCLVSIERPWLLTAFLDYRRWILPGHASGELSLNDGTGLPALPVALVAVKALRIEADWTPPDVSALEQSVQFGPFNFDSRIVDGAIWHHGIQIVGWLLRHLPQLPPSPAEIHEPSDPTTLSDATFGTAMTESPMPVLVEFFAASVGASVAMAPIVRQLAAQYADAVRFVRIDVAASPNTVNRCGVARVPTFILFHGGRPVDALVGPVPSLRLQSLLESARALRKKGG